MKKQEFVRKVSNRKLTDYGFSTSEVSILKPIIEDIDQNNIASAERKIAQMAIDVCDQVEKGILKPKQADNFFMLLDIYMYEHYPNLELKNEIKDLIFEGNILHDYGTSFGSDLNLMRELANKVLKKN